MKETETLVRFAGRFLQLPDKEKIGFVSDQWWFIQDDIYSLDKVLMEAEKGMDLVVISTVNVWRRLFLDAGMRGLDVAIEEHNNRLRYFQRLFERFVGCSRLSEKKKLLQEHPDMLTSVGIYVMNKMFEESLQAALGTGHILTIKQKMGQHLILLIKCVEFGIDFPFREIKMGKDDYWVS